MLRAGIYEFSTVYSARDARTSSCDRNRSAPNVNRTHALYQISRRLASRFDRFSQVSAG